MNRLALILTTVVLTLAGCTSDADSPPSRPTAAASAQPLAPDPATAGCPEGLVEALDVWGDVGFDGVLTVLRGEESCTVAAGLRDPGAGTPMTNDSVFAIGSVSKSFTAAAVLQLVADRRLGLEDTAGSVVPGLSGPAAAATISQLLTHTSGLHGDAGPDHEPLTREEAVAALSALPQTFPAGTDFGYTNAGYTLLALVVDAVTVDYRSYVAEHVLADEAGFWDGEPAADGPRAVGYTDEGPSTVRGDFAGPHWSTSGNGDLAMTVPALAAWTADLFHGELLSEAMTAEVKKPRWDNGDGTSETFGWVRFGKDLFGAMGFASAGGGGDTGHNAIVAHLPAIDTTVAIASSTNEVTAERLMQAIVTDLVAGRRIPHPDGAEAAAPDPETVERASGTYSVDGGGTLVLSGDDGSVTVRAAGDAAVDALFGLPTGLTAADVVAHEAGVVELLTGDNAAGEDERRALGESVGGIEGVELRGTVAEGNELRTYVTVTGGHLTLEGWYALDDQGGVAAAQLPAEPPMQVFDQQRGDTLLSVDPTGRRPDVRLTVAAGLLTIDNGSAVVAARRVG